MPLAAEILVNWYVERAMLWSRSSPLLVLGPQGTHHLRDCGAEGARATRLRAHLAVRSVAPGLLLAGVHAHTVNGGSGHQKMTGKRAPRAPDSGADGG